MSRSHTLFTGQWVDLTLEEICSKAAAWGFDGLELACDAGHFDVRRALDEPGYTDSVRALLESHGLGCWAISAHLVGQAVCDDPIDFRHQAILPADVWGGGDPEGVRQRAAAFMGDAAEAAARFGVDVVVGFTGSAIWPYVAMFPPVSESVIEAGYTDFATRWTPILDRFAEHGVRFALVDGERHQHGMQRLAVGGHRRPDGHAARAHAPSRARRSASSSSALSPIWLASRRISRALNRPIRDSSRSR